MKLNRTLTISAAKYYLTDERVVLSLTEPGRAQFTVQTTAENIKVGSVTALDIGYAQHNDASRLFLGFVESVTPIDGRHCLLFCRELSAMLKTTLPMNLRHPTLRDVLSAIGEKTGLMFSAADKAYSTTKIPHFANVGNGYQAMDSIGRSFRIDDYIYQQQGEGIIYVGSYADSRWAEKTIDIDVSYFKDHLSSNSARIAAIPAMRPGATVNGKRITGLEFAGNFMTMSW